MDSGHATGKVQYLSVVGTKYCQQPKSGECTHLTSQGAGDGCVLTSSQKRQTEEDLCRIRPHLPLPKVHVSCMAANMLPENGNDNGQQGLCSKMLVTA